MKKELFLILIIVCFLTHIIRTVYEILKHKKKLKPNSLSFIIMFINMVLLWMSWFALCNLDIHKIAMPPLISYAGISLAGLGVLIFLTALITIKSLETYEGDLITHGIYSKIRHPMYLAFIFWLIGMPLFYGGLISLVMAFILTANVLLWRYLEEIELVHRFSTYWEYKKTTLF